MKRWRVWAALLGAALLWTVFGAKFVRPVEWPPIPDPAALRREADVLCRGEGGWRELPPGEYPPLIARLHPATISVSGERVYVGLVPLPGGARFHGYYIWPTNANSPGGGVEREQSDVPPSGL